MELIRNKFWPVAVLFLSLPNLAFAQGDSPIGGGGGTTIESPITADSIPEILNRIVDFLLIVAAPLAIIMTIYAGYLYMTAAGSEEKVKKAHKTITYVVIGVALLILSKGIISLVVSFLT